MLSEQRQEMILRLLQEQGSVTVPQIREVLGVSESTIRRDITELDKAGKLTKVFGGAMPYTSAFNTKELSVEQKRLVHRQEKREVAQRAAALIEPGDFVYLDAGTTTGCLIDCLTHKEATFVTNAVDHARRLAVAGHRVFLVGGELRGTTEAVVGSQAILTLQTYHFTKGFFGTNGISRRDGLTTPDEGEGMVKRCALRRCKERYVLADASKFGVVNTVCFGLLEDVTVITDEVPEGYRQMDHLILA